MNNTVILLAPILLKKPSSEGFDDCDDVWIDAIVYGVHVWLELVSEFELAL